jgi:hypothetical protein
MVALAPCGHQGRGVRPRRHHALGGAGDGTSPPPRALSAPLLCPWPHGKREQRSPAVPAIGAHGLSPLRGQARARVVACGGLYAPCYPTPCGVKAPPVGLRYDGNDPMALPPTRCPRARVQGAEQDGVALVVPGGAGIEARFHVVRGGDVGRRSPCKRQRNLRWLRCKAVVVGPRRLPRRSAPDRDTETDADTAKTI